MKILMLDNYDSFTYNLVQYVERVVNMEVDVFRNDKISLDEVANYDKIIISPGPGIPDEAGISKQIIQTFAPEKSILGVCLGHQAIGEVFGAQLRNLDTVYHGVSSVMTQSIEGDYLFHDIPRVFEAGRYHSWIINRSRFPDTMDILAVDEHNTIMAVRHKQYDVRGVQFHPESVLTEFGEQMIQNWLQGPPREMKYKTV